MSRHTAAAVAMMPRENRFRRKAKERRASIFSHSPGVNMAPGSGSGHAER